MKTKLYYSLYQLIRNFLLKTLLNPNVYGCTNAWLVSRQQPHTNTFVLKF